MNCSSKFRQQPAGDTTRVDPTEVDGRPRCTNPLCGRPLQGDGTCTRGCRQSGAVAHGAEPCVLRDTLCALIGWPDLQIEETPDGTAFILRGDSGSQWPWPERTQRAWERLGFCPAENSVVVPAAEIETVVGRLQQVWEQGGLIRWPENFELNFVDTTAAADGRIGTWADHADGSHTRVVEVLVDGRIRGTQTRLSTTDQAGRVEGEQWDLPSEVMVELAHRLPRELHRASGLPYTNPDGTPYEPWELWRAVEIAIPEGDMRVGAQVGSPNHMARLQALIVEPDKEEPLGVRLVGRTEDGERTPCSLRLSAGLLRDITLAVQEKAMGTVVEDGLTGPWTLPLAIRDVAPGPGFTRPPMAQGEGIHTGGVWVSPEGEYWKPLDGRPHMNADVHLPTREAECLELMAGTPGFPRNWRVEEAGEVVAGGRVYRRRWLVRPPARLLPDRDVTLSLEHNVLPIERGLRELNRRGWELGDHLTVAYDPNEGVPFVLDLSTAHPYYDELDRQGDFPAFARWAEACGFEGLVNLRVAGREVTDLFQVHKDPRWPQREQGGKSGPDMRYRHVYASRNRPINAGWANIPGAHYQDADYGPLRVHTWVITPEPLDEETQRAYELTWAWSPVEREGQVE